MFRLMMFSLLFASAFSPRNAHAHFLFIHLDRPAEAGRSAEVFFSEFATSGDPKFVKKIAHTKLWVQSKPGKFRPIEVRQAYDSLKAFVPDAGTIAVVGKCQYGVLQRNVPFLLQYYPKAIAGDPAEIGKLQPFNEIPLEIVAAFVDGKITFTALHKGKPLPGAKFTTVDQFLDNEEFTADKSGRATWKPPLDVSRSEPFPARPSRGAQSKEFNDVSSDQHNNLFVTGHDGFQWGHRACPGQRRALRCALAVVRHGRLSHVFPRVLRRG
ncbi:MAG: hypothetical protein IH991_17220, partial [Planctomycetes bacterium]|nr:hypothetical protein [Planctomycetota bacterium]